MLVLDGARFREAVKVSGYHSLGELARSLGIHRNTIHYYLSGHRVLPPQLEKMVRAVGLKPVDIFVEKERESATSRNEIAPVVDQLHREFPEITFVLFSSRVGAKAHRYSDWDIGVFSRTGLPHVTYRTLLKKKAELIETTPLMVDLVNLNRADLSFLKEISRNWIFLTGHQQDWLELHRRLSQ